MSVAFVHHHHHDHRSDGDSPNASTRKKNPLLSTNRTQRRLLVIGLANSGKTTLVNALRAARRETVKSRSTTTVTPKNFHDEEVVPTMGFAVERFSVLNTTLTVVDMSGQSKYKDTLWECYYEDANAVVFVVDAAESEENVDAARAALEFFLSSPNAEKTGDAKKKKKRRLL